MTRKVVLAGLGPAIHVFLFAGKEDVDARHKAGHDGVVVSAGLTRQPMRPPRRMEHRVEPGGDEK